jgi:hypothetical protein
VSDFPTFVSNLGKTFPLLYQIWEKWDIVGKVGKSREKSEQVGTSRETKQGLRQKQKHSQNSFDSTLRFVSTYIKGNAISRKDKRNDESNMQEHMHPIQVLLASTQVKKSILPIEQNLRQTN